MTQPPPTPWRLGYLLLGLRLPAEYHQWVAEDIASKSFPNWRLLRSFLWGVAALGLAIGAKTLIWEAPARRTVQLLLALPLVYSLLLTRKTLVRRALRFQRIDRRGRPAKPRGLGLLEQVEAVMAVGLIAIGVTAGGALFGFAQRPNGPAGAPCHAPGKDLQARLKAGFRNQAIDLVTPRTVKYAHGEVVATLYKAPSDKRVQFVAFLVENGTIYELRDPGKTKDTTTTFAAPASADRVSVDALQRAVQCLTRAAPR